jgi:hypothetical protein
LVIFFKKIVNFSHTPNFKILGCDKELINSLTTCCCLSLWAGRNNRNHGNTAWSPYAAARFDGGGWSTNSPQVGKEGTNAREVITTC